MHMHEAIIKSEENGEEEKEDNNVIKIDQGISKQPRECQILQQNNLI